MSDKKKEDRKQKPRAGVIEVELFPYVLMPDELARLKQYAAMYIMKYGLEEKTEKPESEEE